MFDAFVRLTDEIVWGLTMYWGTQMETCRVSMSTINDHGNFVFILKIPHLGSFSVFCFFCVYSL